MPSSAAPGQGCGAGTQISGSSSRHQFFWFWLQPLKVFGFGSRTSWPIHERLKTIVLCVQLAYPTKYVC